MGKERKGTILTKPLVVAMLAIVACAFWGSAYPSIKVGYRLLHIASDQTADQLLFAGERFTLSGILVVIFACISQKKFVHPHKTSWKALTCISLTQTVGQYIFFYVAMAHVSGVKGSIIEALSTFVAIFFAVYIFHQERLTTNKVVGSILGFAGTILISTYGASAGGRFTFLGEGCMLLSIIMYALSSCLIRYFTEKEDPLMVSGWQFFFGGLILMAVGKIGGGTWRVLDGKSALLLLWLACISACAYSIWSVLLKYNHISNVTVYSFTNTIFGVVFSAIFLHEGNEISLILLISLVLVCTGIFIANRE